MRHSVRVFPRGTVTGLALLALALGACAGGSEGGGSGGTGGGGEGGSPGSGGGASSTGGTSGGTGGAAPATGGASGGSGGSLSGSGGLLGSGGMAGRPQSGGNGGGGRFGAGGRMGSGGGSGGMMSATGGTTGATGGGSGTLVWPKKFCGNITQRGQIASNYTNYWDQITPENEGKWGSVEGSRGNYNWSALDKIHDFAKQHNIPFKQHNFVWGSQQPGWISGLSQADQKAAVEDWIKQFCTRYPDTPLIDVLNEPPPHTTPPYMAALGGAGSSGYDWVVTIFKWARQYCPNSILIVNDYNNIELSGDNNHTIDLVTKTRAAGGPIDAIGAQAHGLTNASASTTQMYIDKLASSTGVPVFISEFDLNIADDNQQKNQFQSLFTMFWNDSNVKGVTVWGYIEGQTWETNSGLMSSSGTMRPAMTWLMSFLGR
jgi:endo-1,4-beta-xylanase